MLRAGEWEWVGFNVIVARCDSSRLSPTPILTFDEVRFIQHVEIHLPQRIPTLGLLFPPSIWIQNWSSNQAYAFIINTWAVQFVRQNPVLKFWTLHGLCDVFLQGGTFSAHFLCDQPVETSSSSRIAGSLARSECGDEEKTRRTKRENKE